MLLKGSVFLGLSVVFEIEKIFTCYGGENYEKNSQYFMRYLPLLCSSKDSSLRF